MENFKCPVCDSKSVVVHFCVPDYRYFPFESAKYKYLRCLSCKSLFLSNRIIGGDYYKSAYGNKYYKEEKGIKFLLENVYGRIINYRKVHILETLFSNKSDINMLDIGAGDLKFLSSVKNKILKKYAIDIYKNKKSEKDITTINDDFVKHDFKDLLFDVATSWHVIEHIPEPKNFLNKVYKVLKPGGFLVISTPNLNSLGFKLSNAKWYHFDAPRHLVLFNELSLRKLTESLGFRLVAKINLPFEFPLDLYHSLRGIKKILIIPFYPAVKLFSHETITYVFQKR